MSKDYYKILGIEKNATDADIKKSYKKLALEWHPDRNPDRKEESEEKFKEIAEAYHILIDPEKRKNYDLGSSNTDYQGFNNNNTYNPHTIFEHFFKQNGGFPNMSGTTKNPFGGFRFHTTGNNSSFTSSHFSSTTNVKQNNQIKSLPLTLEELYTGCTKKMKITKKLVDASGKVVPVTKILDLVIKPGWKRGTKITFENEGDEIPNSKPGDIIFIIDEKPHKFYTRKDDDLYYPIDINLKQALTGFKLTIQTLDNKPLEIDIREIISPNYKKIIANEGMPNHKNPSQRGNLIIEFNIKFPTDLTPDQRLKIKDIL